MPYNSYQTLKQALDKRKSDSALRKLPIEKKLVDFSSNDYLGFARSKKINASTYTNLKKLKKQNINGSTGSRLISGNNQYIEKLESEIAKFHKADAGLIYNSGYDANVGLFSCISTRHDTILYDELIHASIYDGIRLSLSNSFSFKHNNLLSLEQKLSTAKGNIYVAIESVYSMDGDIPPLKEIVTLCEKYNANLIVDEAHATGIIGNTGKGLVNELKLEKKIFARIHTFGKALGCHGAIILGSKILREYLINFSRSFIYTTALPAHSIAAIKASYDYCAIATVERKTLQGNIDFYKKQIAQKGISSTNNTPIQTIIIPGNKAVKNMALLLEKNGFYTKAILSPTVPKGSERLRICLHSFNSTSEIKKLVDLIYKG